MLHSPMNDFISWVLFPTERTLAQAILIECISGPGFALMSPAKSIKKAISARWRTKLWIFLKFWSRKEFKNGRYVSDGDMDGDMIQFVWLAKVVGDSSPRWDGKVLLVEIVKREKTKKYQSKIIFNRKRFIANDGELNDRINTKKIRNKNSGNQMSDNENVYIRNGDLLELVVWNK